jgi:hypothetical protein
MIAELRQTAPQPAEGVVVMFTRPSRKAVRRKWARDQISDDRIDEMFDGTKRPVDFVLATGVPGDDDIEFGMTLADVGIRSNTQLRVIPVDGEPALNFDGVWLFEPETVTYDLQKVLRGKLFVNVSPYCLCVAASQGFHHYPFKKLECTHTKR